MLTKELILCFYVAISTVVNILLFSTYYESNSISLTEFIGAYYLANAQNFTPVHAAVSQNQNVKIPSLLNETQLGEDEHRFLLDQSTIINSNNKNTDDNSTGGNQLPILFLITPTVRRYTQLADLTRLAQTLRLVPRLHWILVEDSPYLSRRINLLIKRTGLSATHLQISTKEKKFPPHPKGVAQRNLGLTWLRERFANSSVPVKGVVYFADDDNAYDIRLFELMRSIHLVGVWPVAFCGGLVIEKPKLNNVRTQVTGWDVYWNPNRTFATDMAGFAVNLDLILKQPAVFFEFRSALESVFIESLGILIDDLEPMAANYHEVLVWHVKTERPTVVYESYWKRTHGGRTSYYGWYV